MNIKHNIILIITSFLIISFSGCTGKQQQKNQKTNKDSIKLNYNSTNKKMKDDSASIAILTTDGKLIKNLIYKHSEHDVNNYSNEPTYLNYIKGYPLNDTIVGDFDGDGKTEKAWFKDTGITAFEDCQQNASKKSCEGTILFSDKTIKPLKIDYCPMLIFKNEGDLYSDGKDVIGILPGGFNSACRAYSVFSLKKGRWRLACPPISNTMNMREAGIVLIEKDLTKKGYVVIRESVESYISRNQKNNIPKEYITGSCRWSDIVEQTIKLN